MNLPPLNDETGKPGTPLNPYEVTFDRAFVQGFLDKTGESADDYAVAGQAVVPPGIYLAAYGRLIHESFHYTAGVHVSSDMKVLAMMTLNRSSDRVPVSMASLKRSTESSFRRVIPVNPWKASVRAMNTWSPVAL